MNKYFNYFFNSCLYIGIALLVYFTYTFQNDANSKINKTNSQIKLLAESLLIYNKDSKYVTEVSKEIIKITENNKLDNFIEFPVK